MTFFWILWIFNALMALIPVYFFFVGLGDGTVTSRNMGIWAILLLAIVAILGGTQWLRMHQHLGIAKTILIIAAIPGLFFLLYLAIVVIGKPRWN